MPSGNPGWLWLVGIQLARLSPPIDHDDAAPKATEVDAGGQAGRARADDDGVEPLVRS